MDVEKVVNAYMKAHPEMDRDILTKKIISQTLVKLDETKYGYSSYDKDSVMLISYGADTTKSGVKLVGGQVFSTLDKAQLIFWKKKLVIIIGSVVGGLSLVIIFVQLSKR